MKNINEIEDTLKILNEQYEEIKTRYNQHAAFNISLKSRPIITCTALRGKV